MSDLLPCPFCGSDDLRVHALADGLGRVTCNQCNCMGPIEGLFEDGETWNTRAELKLREDDEAAHPNNQSTDDANHH